MEYRVLKFDPETEEESMVTVLGSEIVSEQRICASCAGAAERSEPVLNLRPFLVLTAGAIGHSGGCHKPLNECKHCKGIVQMFAGFPLAALSVALEDKLPTTPVKFSFASVAVENLLNQGRDDNSDNKRMKRSFEAGYKILKQYEQAGGGL